MRVSAKKRGRGRGRGLTLADIERWRVDPVAFCEEVLGFTPWTCPDIENDQAALIRKLAMAHRATVRSGHKIGKSRSAAALALWEYTLFPGSRIVLTAPGNRQVKEVLWREITTMFREARIPLGGELAIDPGTGLRNRSTDSQILGFSTDDPDRFSGISGARVRYIVDEASGVHERIYAAMKGNLAGGASLILFSNPTQPTGTFFDSHHTLGGFMRLHVDSADVARAQEDGRMPTIPGLATMSWVRECLDDWGESSAEYDIRVRGAFPAYGEAGVIPLALYEEAVARPAPIINPNRDRLVIGLDIARFGDDSSVAVARRGSQIFAPVQWKGLDSVQLAIEVERYVRSMLGPGEGRASGSMKPIVNIDTIGIGAGVFDILSRSPNLEAVSIDVSRAAPDAERYVNLRTQIWFAARDRMRTSSITAHELLRADLTGARYGYDARNRYKLESKDEMKKRLGRSPDYGDAFCLACWEPRPFDARPVHIPGL